MTMPSLPVQGSTNWYAWAQKAHAAAAEVTDGRLTDEALRAAFDAWGGGSGGGASTVGSVLALGTSITAGFLVDQSQRWPTLLPGTVAALLPGSPALTVTNGGVSGNTSEEMLARLPALLSSGRPNVVLIETSINDARADLSVTTADAVAHMRSMIALCRAYGARPIVATAAPIDPAAWGGPQYTSASVTKANDINTAVRAALTDLRVELVDLDTYFGTPANLIDGIHPNPTGHGQWATAFARVLAGRPVGTAGAVTPPAATVPGAPAGLTAGSPGGTSVPLSWTAPASNGGASITDYAVQYRTPVGSGSWTTFADGSTSNTTATVTGLAEGTAYEFQVAAVNSAGTGAYSATATATTTATSGGGGADSGPSLSTVRGTPGYTAGKFGSAMSGGALRLADASSFTVAEGTLELWAKLPAAVSALKVAFGDGNLWLGAAASGTAALGVPGATSGGSRIDDGAWHHLAYTWSSSAGQAALYVDGARVTTEPVSGNFTWAATLVTIGGYGDSSNTDWPGLIDEVRVSKVVRYSGTTYTVPTAIFTADPNTLALYHLEG